MDFMAAIKSGFRNYATFRGTATRSEYWYWVLFIALAGIALSILESAIWPFPHYAMMQGYAGPEWAMAMQGNSPLSDIFGIGILVPTLAVTARRFHDAGFSAKWLWLQAGTVLLAIAGMIGLVVTLASSSLMFGYGAPSELGWAAGWAIMQALTPALLFGLGYAIFQLIVTIRPSVSAEAGNKYAVPTVAASPVEESPAEDKPSV
ncbi:uncharacterized membrane protein YhaH (DUF805 family) [Microbacteriaceae bacterium MWH-Ta3]|nr:uncharacterized membrane protein YhaH (DUF805 family) [Microbacteriaceae bacterium MWH-Ta3]